MRPMLVALSILALGGCAGSSKTSLRPQADSSGPTPVARPMPSLSQRIMNNRLRDGQTIVGKTDVEGALVR